MLVNEREKVEKQNNELNVKLSACRKLLAEISRLRNRKFRQMGHSQKKLSRDGWIKKERFPRKNTTESGSLPETAQGHRQLEDQCGLEL